MLTRLKGTFTFSRVTSASVSCEGNGERRNETRYMTKKNLKRKEEDGKEEIKLTSSNNGWVPACQDLTPMDVLDQRQVKKICLVQAEQRGDRTFFLS